MQPIFANLESSYDLVNHLDGIIVIPVTSETNDLELHEGQLPNFAHPISNRRLGLVLKRALCGFTVGIVSSSIMLGVGIGQWYKNDEHSVTGKTLVLVSIAQIALTTLFGIGIGFRENLSS